MADPLTEALGQVQGQYLQTSPSYQFGSVLSQQRNPYATADDPWSAIAANAAQQLFAGLATGYGQQQAANQMAQIAPLVPQLYQNPMAVQAPNVDRDILSFLQVAAQNQQAKRATDLQDLALQEQIKVAANPASKLSAIQGKQAEIELKRQMAALLGLPPETVAESVRSEFGLPAGQMPTAKAPPTPEIPTQGVQSNVQPLGEIAVPDFNASMQKYMSQGIDSKTAADMSRKDQEEALKFNRDLKLEGFKQKGSLEELKAKEAATEREEINKQIEASSKALSGLDANVTQLEFLAPNLPDYGTPFFGDKKRTIDQMLARAPDLFGNYKTQAQKNLAAESYLDALNPKNAGEVIKQALPGPLTEKELGFVLKAMLSASNTPAQNQAVLNSYKTTQDLARYTNTFLQYGAKKGLTRQQINQKFEQARSQFGGNLLDPTTGQVKPEVKAALTEMQQALGGGL